MKTYILTILLQLLCTTYLSAQKSMTFKKTRQITGTPVLKIGSELEFFTDSIKLNGAVLQRTGMIYFKDKYMWYPVILMTSEGEKSVEIGWGTVNDRICKINWDFPQKEQFEMIKIPNKVHPTKNSNVTNSIKSTPNLSFNWLKTLGNNIYKYSIPGEYNIREDVPNIQINSITTDNSKSVYTTGYFEGYADFNPGEDTFILRSEGRSIFVCKIDSAGKFKWATHWGNFDIGDMRGGNLNEGSAITVDKSGQVFTTGYLWDAAKNSTIGFVCKLDSNGETVWNKTYTGERGTSIVTSSTGNIYVAISNFTYKLDTKGNVQWHKELNTKSLAIDQNDIIYSGGSGVIHKLDTSGKIIWNIDFNENNEGSAKIVSLAVDKLGNIFSAGTFNSKTDFDPGPKTYTLVGFDWDANSFILKLDSNGNFKWVRKIGGFGHQSIASIATDNDGNIYTTGNYNMNFDYYGLKCEFSKNINTNLDNQLFITKSDNLGNLKWMLDFGGNNSESGNSINIDKEGNILTSGTYGLDYDDYDNNYYHSHQNYNNIVYFDIGQTFLKINPMNPKGNPLIIKLKKAKN